MNLKEWTKHYIKFQDCMKRKIVSLEEIDTGYTVKEKKEEKEYKTIEQIEKIPKIDKNKKTYIVTLNTKENVEAILINWDKLVKEKQTTILFVNPEKNQKWHIQPYHHQKISEDIEKSVRILFGNTTPCK